MRAASFAIASIVAALTVRSGALPDVSPATRHAMTARAPGMPPAALRFGRSVGSPTAGRLIGGMHLEEAAYLRMVPVYAPGDVRWGLQPLVAMIERAARAVRRQFPEAVLSVGHLSRSGGGDLDRHRSHESGRDADIAFFVRSVKGKELFASHFVPFRGDGTAATWPGAYFDDAKNWALVESLVGDPEGHVTHLFVASPLRARLLAYAERVGAPGGVRMRAAELMQQPRGTLPHDDHFHVRIGCPPKMTSCVENPAARVVRPAPSLMVHGRRTAAPRPEVDTAPKRGAAPAPSAPDPGKDTPDPEDSPADPAIPPAAMPAPLDDVDG
ncbi:MAG TPA: penicillin-insensitive murein endopeptidase [Polyangiaceae bacterium]